MELTSFRTPFEKVYRRTKQTFIKKGFAITEDEKNPGVMMARRKATFLYAAMNLEIIISRIDESSCSISITSNAGKHWLDNSSKSNRKIEGMYIAMITTRI
jgi:hypothetical protein